MATIDDVKYWFDEIRASLKRDKQFRKTGKRVFEIYDGCEKQDVPFNILYSNTDTLLPALYSNTPRPVVQRRFKNDDPVGKAASDASIRMLEYLFDTNVEGYESFDDALSSVTLDALLPGRGVTRVVFDAEVSEGDYVAKENVCVDSVVWDRILFGYARKWSKVPWIAFEEFIDKDEAKRLFGNEIAAKLSFTTGEKSEDSRDERHEPLDDDSQGGIKTVCIYQIWDKTNRKVRWICEQYKDDFLKVDDDPLELSGFYPIPKPLQFIEKSHNLTPTAPYTLYETQAEELNVITRRIGLLANAIKAKGIYDGELGDDIRNLLEGDDNEFIAAEKGSSLVAQGGFRNAIWFMPLDVMMTVLQNLYSSRSECKSTIYEITGISDILRGATDPNETFGAQNIKSQWGTMRLKRSQKAVQVYARDLSRIMLEIAVTKFDASTWASITQLPYSPEDWAQVLGMLKDDMQRAYRVDIETNSTILPEAAEDQKQIFEAMQALGQYLQGVTPLVQNGSLPFEAAKAMMMTVVRRFRFGNEIEDQINSMQAPPSPQPPPDTSAQEAQVKLQLQAQQLESNRQIAEGNAKTNIHIAELENNVRILLAKMQGAISPEDLEDLSHLKDDLMMFKSDLQTQLATVSIETQQTLSDIITAIDSKFEDVDTKLIAASLPRTRVLIRDENGVPVAAKEVVE